MLTGSFRGCVLRQDAHLEARGGVLRDRLSVLVAVKVREVVAQWAVLVDGVRELGRQRWHGGGGAVESSRCHQRRPVPLTIQLRPRKGILLRDSLSSTGRRPTQPSSVR